MFVQWHVLGQQIGSFPYCPARRWLCLAMPRWPIELQSKHSGAITLGKSEEKEKVILLGMAVIDDSKAFEVGGICMENIHMARATAENARAGKPCQELSCWSILTALKDDDGEWPFLGSLLEIQSRGKVSGGSQIHWASAVWQRFRSALLNAMWPVHQNKKPNKLASAKTHWHSPMPLTFTSSLSPVCASCHLPELRAQFYSKPTASTAWGDQTPSDAAI